MTNRCLLWIGSKKSDWVRRTAEQLCLNQNTTNSIKQQLLLAVQQSSPFICFYSWFKKYTCSGIHMMDHTQDKLGSTNRRRNSCMIVKNSYLVTAQHWKIVKLHVLTRRNHSHILGSTNRGPKSVYCLDEVMVWSWVRRTAARDCILFVWGTLRSTNHSPQTTHSWPPVSLTTARRNARRDWIYKIRCISSS